MTVVMVMNVHSVYRYIIDPLSDDDFEDRGMTTCRGSNIKLRCPSSPLCLPQSRTWPAKNEHLVHVVYTRVSSP